MTVAILTMFNGLSTTYSLVNVVADQLQMLLDAGIPVRLLVSEDCPDGDRQGVFADKRVEWIKVTNRLRGQPIVWRDYTQASGQVHDTFFEEADAIAADLTEKLRGCDVCMLHDILYQGWHLVHNVAVRKAQKELPGLRFLAFTHSLPAIRPPKAQWPFSARFTPMPNTRYVYPTQSGLPALARQYDVPEGRCAAVYNAMPLLGAMSDAVREVGRHVDLYGVECLAVYPGRLTTGKQFEKAAALLGAIKRKTERSAALVLCDFPSADIDPQTYKAIIRTEGKRAGLEDGDLVFTSDVGYPNGFPRQSVLELFTLSNLFVCPSYSESFGLTVLEAASRGNFLVLNEAVPALKELGTSLGAYFLRWDARNFGFDTHEQYHPSEQAYLEEHALAIVDRMRTDVALAAKTLTRTRYNTAWIYRNQLAPLLER